jgi:hypothetical protein
MGFWLIQRGKFNDTKNEYKGLTGRDGLIELDYMGSSEFEWGAIPKAYRRIMGDFNQYIYHYIHDIKDYRGKLLVVFCKKDKVENVENEIKNYINNSYRLKEYCTLKYHISGSGNEHRLKKDFFWNIDNNSTGDWMGFFGMDKLTPFKTAITNDYNNWWMLKTEVDREKEYKEAFR